MQKKINIHYFFSAVRVDVFVDELRWEEDDSVTRDKIRELKLTSDEWVRVTIFLGLLGVCLPLYIYIKT